MNLDLPKNGYSRKLAYVILAIAALFVLRLFYLQIIKHSYYVDQARAIQERRFVLPAQRGEIYALDGESPVKLVMNQTVYTVFADPKTITQKDEIIETLREVAGGNLRQGFADLLDQTDTRYQVLGTKLTTTQRDKIKAKNYYGIGFQAVSQRVYPEGKLASQVLGFVNAEGTGAYGIEGYMNERLKGEDGLLQSVADVRDVPLTIGKNNIRIEPQNGDDLVLSIDRNIQSKVEQAILAGVDRTGAPQISALVMNPNTGRVMAMANYPSYNPAEFYKVRDAAIFNNNTISVPYEPGSTIKAFTMATAIDKNVAHATDTYNNTDYITVGDRTISNASKGRTGLITFQTAMEWSLNTGFVTIAQRLGDGRNINRTARDTMYDYFYNRFRLGQATGIELSNEAHGSIISPQSSMGNEVRYSNMSFGQGMESTMLQVAAGFSSAVNGGTYYQPSVVAGVLKGGEIESTKPEVKQAGLIAGSTSRELVEDSQEQLDAIADQINNPPWKG
ncbi:hypothetical protein B7Z17_00065 [Candidatus Saccharibacteria bacterium 32-49-10]|nr:MAG: hypothetical protein B7Z17_00065 [Candidatus Saccharibacteria bacterium 32-49-10]